MVPIVMVTSASVEVVVGSVTSASVEVVVGSVTASVEVVVGSSVVVGSTKLKLMKKIAIGRPE